MIELRVNRASRLFKQAFENLQLSLKPALETENTCFSYLIDKEAEDLPDLRQQYDRVLYLLRSGEANRLADKWRFAEALLKYKIHDVFAPTYNSVKDALASHPDHPVWYIKSRHGTAGKNMQCLNVQELQNHELQQGYIIQYGLSDIATLDSRKFTTRVYLFLWNGLLFLYHDGFAVIHGEKYDETSTCYKVQINHKGYMTAENNIDMVPLSALSAYRAILKSMRQKARKLKPALAPALKETSRDCYLMLGLDMLVLASGDTRFLEINAVPNFVHTGEINKDVNIPFFESCIKRMFDQPADSLIEI